MKNKLHNTTSLNQSLLTASVGFLLDTLISTSEWIYSRHSCSSWAVRISTSGEKQHKQSKTYLKRMTTNFLSSS